MFIYIPSDTLAIEVSQETIQQSWHFVSFAKYPSFFGEFPGPPTFDVMQFGHNKKATLRSTIDNTSVEGEYELNGETLTVQFKPDNVDSPITYRMECKHGINTGTLLMRFHEENDIVLVYRDSDHLLSPTPLIGEWHIDMDGISERMILEENGAYHLTASDIHGYFRVWNWSHQGDILTVVVTMPDRRDHHVMNYRYKLVEDSLLLTPFIANRFDSNSMEWTRYDDLFTFRGIRTNAILTIISFSMVFFVALFIFLFSMRKKKSNHSKISKNRRKRK